MKMKIKETISTLQLIGNDSTKWGLFSQFGNVWNTKYSEQPPFITDNHAVAMDYYLHHSGDKYLSPLFKKLYDIYIDNGMTESELYQNLSQIIINQFGDKWLKIYNALMTDYEPLENYNMQETKTPNLTESVTSNKYSTDNFNESTNLTTSTNSTSKTGIFGFNSGKSNPSGDATGNQSVVVSGDDNDNFSSRTTSNADSLTRSNTGTEQLSRSGNIGVTTSQQMLESEIKLRQYNFIYEMFNDIDTLLCLSIY